MKLKLSTRNSTITWLKAFIYPLGMRDIAFLVEDFCYLSVPTIKSTISVQVFLDKCSALLAAQFCIKRRTLLWLRLSHWSPVKSLLNLLGPDRYAFRIQYWYVMFIGHVLYCFFDLPNSLYLKICFYFKVSVTEINLL